MPNQKIQLLRGDCVERLRGLDPNSRSMVVVSDPPYGISFMGREWDHLDWQTGEGSSLPGIGERETPWPSYPSSHQFGGANPTCGTCGGRARGSKRCECEDPDWKPISKRKTHPEDAIDPLDITPQYVGNQMQQSHALWLREAFRVIEPGGSIKAFSGSRTWHRLAAAMVSAGFVGIRVKAWCYASGFPKSMNISRKIDEIVINRRNRGLLKKLALQGLDLDTIEWVAEYPPDGLEDIKVNLGGSKFVTLQRVRDNIFVQHPLFKHRDKKILTAEETSFRNWAASEGAEEGWSRPWIEQAREDGFYEIEDDNPVTPQGEKYQGWGTALKPAYEPVLVGIKPKEDPKNKYEGIPDWELL